MDDRTGAWRSSLAGGQTEGGRRPYPAPPGALTLAGVMTDWQGVRVGTRRASMGARAVAQSPASSLRRQPAYRPREGGTDTRAVGLGRRAASDRDRPDRERPAQSGAGH